MATSVNLDALIPREDFEAASPNDDASRPPGITIRDLEAGAFFYQALRKPDFQRESSEWDPARVTGLIKTFIQGDLIPAVILWKHREYLFVIDGAHRLSALIAWVLDDYGDGEVSQKYYGHSVSQDQKAQADKVRRLVNKEVGSYADLQKANASPELFGPDMIGRARALASRTLTLQWVVGSFTVAEDSFIRINQQAANITPQELQLIRGRKRPDVIAARAIMRRGSGHLSSSRFSDENLKQIKEISQAVFNLLFEPEMTYPVKSLNLPVGGGAYSGTALKMVHDFIVLSVGQIKDEADDVGARTIEILKRTRRSAELICSNVAGSMGLHPAIYFYSWTGKQQPILFLTVADMILEHERNKTLSLFLNRRKAFEDFIIGNRALLNQIVRKFGTKDSGKNHLKAFYQEVFKAIDAGVTGDAISEQVIRHKAFTYLQPSESPYSGVSAGRYDAAVKSGLVIGELIPGALRCGICGGLVPSQAISIDHRQEISAGGDSKISNLQVAHPRCNNEKTPPLSSIF
ncbi:HNH endonuclease family protein [Luteimonas cellulosilyticus]|nr:DUF262 domain-containing protein [Luteimonas cellulosilyticus]